MTVDQLKPAEQPTFYFVGVTTGQSSINKVFPRWVEHLGREDVVLKGIDLVQHDEPQKYRDVVSFIKEDKNSLGGLVTTHKIDLLDAAKDLFDGFDEYAELLGEVSGIAKKDGKLWGYAKDPITSGLALEAFLPREHWSKTGGHCCLLGAGGSSLALTTYLIKDRKVEACPKEIVVTNRSEKRLESMEEVHKEINPGVEIRYYHCPHHEQNDQVVSSLPDHSLVVNATGLGKDAPGSPLTENALFPMNGFAWEFNYRGDLLFMEQAKRQEKERNLFIEDGWVYFVHGWTRVMEEVLHMDIPESGPEFDELSRIAREARKS